MKFRDVPQGTDISIDGKRYRKCRPWAPEQFNAFLMEADVGADAGTFRVILPEKEVRLFRRLPTWRLN